ncbi:MAG: CBS domain-containing protein [Geminicoccaceae bacterium]
MVIASDLMTKDILSVSPEMTLGEVADIMMKMRITGLPVVDEAGKIRGMVSEEDLVRRMKPREASRGGGWLSFMASGSARSGGLLDEKECKVEEAMTKDILMASEDETLVHLISLLARKRIKRLPIVRDGKLVGMVSRVDILRFLAETGHCKMCTMNV